MLNQPKGRVAWAPVNTHGSPGAHASNHSHLTVAYENGWHLRGVQDSAEERMMLWKRGEIGGGQDWTTTEVGHGSDRPSPPRLIGKNMKPETPGYHPLDMTVLLKGINAVLELAFTHSEYPRYVLQDLLEDGGLEEVVRRIGTRDDTSLVTVREVIQIMDDVISTDATFTPDEPETEEGLFPPPTTEATPEFPEPLRHSMPHEPPAERVLLQQIEAVLATWRAGQKNDTEALRIVKTYLARHMFLTINTSLSEVGATVQIMPVEERNTPPRA